jgi:hypothetical protein
MVPGYSIMGSYVSGRTDLSSSRDAYPDPGGAYRNRGMLVLAGRRTTATTPNAQATGRLAPGAGKAKKRAATTEKEEKRSERKFWLPPDSRSSLPSVEA